MLPFVFAVPREEVIGVFAVILEGGPERLAEFFGFLPTEDAPVFAADAEEAFVLFGWLWPLCFLDWLAGEDGLDFAGNAGAFPAWEGFEGVGCDVVFWIAEEGVDFDAAFCGTLVVFFVAAVTFLLRFNIWEPIWNRLICL